MPHIRNRVTELRKEGKIEEALGLAQKMLERNPSIIQCKIDLGWVFYEFIKKYVKERNSVQISAYLIRFDSLRIPNDEKLIHQQINKNRPYTDQNRFIVFDAYQKSKEEKHLEALELYKRAFALYPIDEEVKLSLGWEYYWVIKVAIEQRNADLISTYLNEFDRINILDEDLLISNINRLRKYSNKDMFIYKDAIKLSKEGKHKDALNLYRKVYSLFPDDNELKDGLGWELEKEIAILTKDFKKLTKEHIQSELKKIRLLLMEFLKLNIVKPSKLYSLVLMRITNISDSYDKFPYFVKEWGLENLNDI